METLTVLYDDAHLVVCVKPAGILSEDDGSPRCMPQLLREHYRALDAAADDCTACAACEPRCPFGVPIAERMEKAAELFA